MNAFLRTRSLAATAIQAAAVVWLFGVGASLGADAVPVVINEVLASNSRFMTDAQGHYDDWIELHNRGDALIDLGGMYLTDDLAEPTKWQFPTDVPALTTVVPKGYVLVWADNDVAAVGLHAAFKLSAEGETVALFDRDGKTLIDSVTFGTQTTDVSYGRFQGFVDTWGPLTIPTPGTPNYSIYQGFVEKPQIGPAHGFYDVEIEVTISCPTEGVTIYYTTDGSEPYSAATMRPNVTASVYGGPLRIAKTTCLRATAVRTGWRPSSAVTSTYIFVADVIAQSPQGQRPGPAWPAGSVNGQVIDYGMDPDVANDPRYKDLMDDALLMIPSVSLVTDLANLFDSQKGIYVNARNEGRSWERPVSVELIDPNGGTGFQIDAGIRIRGGFSRSGGNPKHSFRLFFRSEYGAPVLRYPLFGSEGAGKFENLDLRTAQNYAWSLDSSNPGEKNTFIREVFCRDLQRETGRPYTRSRYYHLYLNGQYWGLYQSQERSEASYAETYFGGEADDYDVIMTDGYRTSYTDGSIDEWNLLWDLCEQGFASDEPYYVVQGKGPDGRDDPSRPVRVDVGNLIDYMIGIFYTGNDDAPVTLSGTSANNFFAIRNRTPESRHGWTFFAYDNEHSLGVARGIHDDRTGMVSAGQSRAHFNPQWLHQKLMAHPEYCMQFADHVHRHFFNAGAMTPEKAIALCLSRASQIDFAIIAESARWGDQRPARVNNPYTKEHWWAEVNGFLVERFFPVRTGIVLNQLRNRGLYPRIDAPVFYLNGSYQHGGSIASSDVLSMTGGGSIWYTLDGSDPRVPGVQASTGGGTTTLVAENAAKRVFVPTGPVSDAWRGGEAFDDSSWISGAGGVGYERSTGYEPYFTIDLVGAMYAKRTSCYVRIPFTLDKDPAQLETIQLRVRYDDGFIAYLNGVEVARRNFTGEPAWNSAAAAQNYDLDAISFEDITLADARTLLRTGQNILAIQGLNESASSSDFLISVVLVSSAEAAGAPAGVAAHAIPYSGPIALEGSVCIKARALSGSTWSALNEAVFAVGPVAESLRISEIMYHPISEASDLISGIPEAEYIELTNVGDAAIDLNLVRFTKGIDYTFPRFELPPGGYCLLVKDIPAFEARYGGKLPVVGQYTGSLSNGGEKIELVDALGGAIQSFEYQDSWFDLTDGRGYSLTVRDPRAELDLSDEAAWRPSAHAGGSPGTGDDGT